jgi:dienelactone hydrolase
MTRLLLALCSLVAVEAVAAAEAPAEKGTIAFKPLGDESAIPERYRLTPHEFPFELKLRHDAKEQGFAIYKLTFPSPVRTKFEVNNTVHADYYRPHGAGPFPTVILLDILDGSQTVCQVQAAILAKNQIAALHVQMPYYGPRRPPGEQIRLLSPAVEESIENIRQTVLDVRRAAAWLASRPDVDRDRLAIMGTSLGSFMASLSAAMEPRLGRAVIILGGGNLVDAYWDDPRATPYRKAYEESGGTKEKLQAIIAPVDPITYAEQLKQRKLLFLAAKRDDIVPPKAAESLWQATGKQKIVWYDATHVGSAIYLIPAMQHAVEHLKGK